MNERSEQASDSHALPRFLETVTDSVSQHPKATLWVVGLLTLLSVAVTARFLEFKSNRADLIDPSEEFHQRWLDYTEEFGDESDIVVVVEASDETEIKLVVDTLGRQLEAEPQYFDRVLYRIDAEQIRPKALQYLAPKDLETVNNRLEAYSPILEGHWSRAGLEFHAIRLNEEISRIAKSGNQREMTIALRQTRKLCDSLNQFIQEPSRFSNPWPEIVPTSNLQNQDAFEPRYLLSNSGSMGFILVTPKSDASSFTGAADTIGRLRTICAAFPNETGEVTIGLTGIPVLEADEMQRSQDDMMKASIISFAGVGLILLIGFRGLRHPFLALIMLAVGLAWSLGYTTLAIGHLNILSVSFAAILIGLGIDFAIHYLSRYIELRHHNQQFHESLSQTSKSVGTGIVTAAITTSLAFFCATFTNFLGVAELGLIAGGGIILCGIATFTALPALLTLADQKMEPRQLPTPFQGYFIRSMIRQRPGVVTFVTLMVIIAVGCRGFRVDENQIESKVRYDSNLLNLQAKGVESVELQRHVFQEANGSLLYAVSIADSLPEARIMKEDFLALPTVSRVEEIISMMPRYPPSETNLLIQAIHARLSRLSDLPREFPQLDPLSIGKALENLHETLSEQTVPDALAASQSLDTFLNTLTQLELPQQMEILAGYQAAMLTALHRQLQALNEVSQPEPVSPENIPAAIRTRFASDSGRWLLRVYPNEQIWEEEPLAEFVNEIRTVDPDATGTPLQNYEAARQIRESYSNAAIYALVVICLVLLIDALEPGALFISLTAPLAVVAFAMALQHQSAIEINPIWMICFYTIVVGLVAAIFDFSSVCDVLLTLLPPLAGGFLMFGILGMFEIHLNPANLIVLPLILGIGVDDGVHVIHDYRNRTGQYETSPSTINAVTLTSLTSMIGFGSMLVAAHQGLVSLGLVLVIGVGSCLFLSLVTLPAILTLLDRHSKTEDLKEESLPESEVISISIDQQRA